MTRTHHNIGQCTLFILFILISNASLIAQSIWTTGTRDNSMSFEYDRPSFKSSAFNFSGAAYLLSGDFSIGENTSLVLQLPFASGSMPSQTYTYPGFSFSEPGISQNGVGNPYIGIEKKIKYSESFFEIGFRPPVASESNSFALAVGTFGDLDQMEAFGPDYLFLQAIGNYKKTFESGFTIRGRIGPDVWIRTKSSAGGNSVDVVLAYSLQPGYIGESFEILAGYSGRMNATVDVQNFSDRFLEQVGLSAAAHVAGFSPGVEFRLPVDKNLRQLIDYTYGFFLAVDF